ncbi:acylphosphatase [Lysinibacillus sp. 54212]|uniref:acylphosphatase n=1 Tax=Lysinibacillus sp. 54212 TaxID=3119829 RepID=UPI002FCB6B5B
MGKRVKIEFFGDVKGTGYRFFIKQKAIELGLKGYCQLNHDEKLEVEVEGSTKAIDEFIDFVQRGVSLQAESNQFNVRVFEDLIGYTVMKSDIV